ncbi:MAG: toprim domain-containing protein [Rhodomicrobium sp.]
MEALSFDDVISAIGNKFGKLDAVCPLCSASRSTAEKRKRKVLRVWREEEDFLTYHCVHCGEKGWLCKDGDAALLNLERIEAGRKEAQDREREARQQRIGKARYLWRASRPIQRTPAERYLREVRGISCALPPTLRFLPASRPGYHPALIAAYGLPREPEPGRLEIGEDEIQAVQLTLLAENGLAKAVNEAGLSKIGIGPSLGTPIVVAPIPDSLTLAICEGVEDALSIHEATGIGAWASTGAKKLAALAPTLPKYIETIAIFADEDADGRAGAQALAKILRGRDCEIRLVLPAKRERVAA